LYASSSSVYGENAKVPFSEDDRVDHPVSLYAATKKSNELMAHTYSHLYGIKTTGLRFFTVYGPWGRPDMAPILFANAIRKNQPIKVFNNGDMERDFTYIDDIIEGIVRLARSIDEGKEYPDSRILNIGNGKPVNLLAFIETLENSFGKKVVKIMTPMQDGDVPRTWADTTGLVEATNYSPQINLIEGIGYFAGWFNGFYNYLIAKK
jgi:UDP-glucuronate 4-epimerase